MMKKLSSCFSKILNGPKSLQFSNLCRLFRDSNTSYIGDRREFDDYRKGAEFVQNYHFIRKKSSYGITPHMNPRSRTDNKKISFSISNFVTLRSYRAAFGAGKLSF